MGKGKGKGDARGGDDDALEERRVELVARGQHEVREEERLPGGRDDLLGQPECEEREEEREGREERWEMHLAKGVRGRLVRTSFRWALYVGEAYPVPIRLQRDVLTGEETPFDLFCQTD